MKLWARAKTLFARAPDFSASLADSAFREAVAHHQQGRLAEAEQLYKRVLELQDDHVAALNFLGVLAYQLEDPARSVELIAKAIALDPSQPGFHSNLALSLNAVGRARDAIASCDRAIALDPGCVEAHSNKGNSLWGMGERAEALASYARALAIDPGHAQTHWNEGFLRLQIGEFDLGWRKHEWRWQLAHVVAHRRDFAGPLWLGKEDIRGKTILLHAEQGLGDTLQFCRYAKMVSALGAAVVLEVQAPLKALLANLEGVSCVVARGETLPEFDVHCPLWSLPLAFGTTFESIPAGAAYVRPGPAAIARWRDKLGPKSLPRVGIVWMGSNGDRRSVPLEDALALATGDRQFVCLQKDLGGEDRRRLEQSGAIAIVADDLIDFSDTAAVVELMDLVITIDTSVAHLAAAMGKRVWILLAFNPDWRWFLDRDDSPWYPSARLFRQPAPGDWASVIARVREELAKLRP